MWGVEGARSSKQLEKYPVGKMACSVGGGGRLVMVVAMYLSGGEAYKATVLSVDVRTRNK